jgi:CO/xanthine dehydrogenase FAD-binding subunit
VVAPIDQRERFPELVAEAASPIDDVRGTAAYRRHALRVLTKRALDRCLT